MALELTLMQCRTSEEERELVLVPVKFSHPPEYSTFQTLGSNCAFCDLVEVSQLDFLKPQSNQTVTVQNQNVSMFQKMKRKKIFFGGGGGKWEERNLETQ